MSESPGTGRGGDPQLGARQPTGEDGSPEGVGPELPWRWVLGGVLTLAGILRLVGLERQLWLDEISALTASIRRPVVEILTEWPLVTSHPLFDLLSHASAAALGETPLALRLPAALFGVAGVWALYRLGREVAGPLTGIVAAALLTVSFHHVFFSQNARGYTALVFFYVVATLVALPAARRRLGRGEGTLYTASSALAAYSHPFGIFVAPGHVLCLGLVELRGRRDADVSGGEGLRGTSLLAWGGAGLGVAVLLYLPYLASILEMASQRIAMPTEGSRMGVGLLMEVIEGLQAGLGGTVPLVAATAIGGVGAWVWVRRHPVALALLVAPLALEAAALAALGVGLHPRYFLPALPVGLLVGASGLVVLVRGAARFALSSRPDLRRRITALVLALAVLATAAPLSRYYRYPKQDFTGALEEARRFAMRAGTPVGVYLAGHVLNGYYGADLASAEDLDDLESLEARHDSLVLITTLERVLEAHDPDLHRHIHRSYERVGYLPGTVGDGAMRIYRGPDRTVDGADGTISGEPPAPGDGDGSSPDRERWP